MLQYQPIDGVSLYFFLYFFIPLIVCIAVFVCIAPRSRAEAITTAVAIGAFWVGLCFTLFRLFVGIGYSFAPKKTTPTQASVIVTLVGLALLAVGVVVRELAARLVRSRQKE